MLARNLEMCVASLDYDTVQKAINKGAIRLCGCAGWSTPLFFANKLSRVETQMIQGGNSVFPYHKGLLFKERMLQPFRKGVQFMRTTAHFNSLTLISLIISAFWIRYWSV